MSRQQWRWLSTLGRRWAVACSAWGLRKGISEAAMLEVLRTSYRHRDVGWRMAVLEDAQARNRERMALR